jgi:hypothetical protein
MIARLEADLAELYSEQMKMTVKKDNGIFTRRKILGVIKLRFGSGFSFRYFYCHSYGLKPKEMKKNRVLRVD